MKKDIPLNLANNVGIAIVHEKDILNNDSWNVYLLNFKTTVIETILITIKGYGVKDDKNVITSNARYSLKTLEGNHYSKIEGIQTELFGLTNEYWVSFFENGKLYEKKFVFMPESVVKENFTLIPLINKNGVMIK